MSLERFITLKPKKYLNTDAVDVILNGKQMVYLPRVGRSLS